MRQCFFPEYDQPHESQTNKDIVETIHRKGLGEGPGKLTRFFIAKTFFFSSTTQLFGQNLDKWVFLGGRHSGKVFFSVVGSHSDHLGFLAISFLSNFGFSVISFFTQFRLFDHSIFYPI